MRRRDLLKSCLVAPFLGLFKKNTRSNTRGNTRGNSCYTEGSTANDICNMALKLINEPNLYRSDSQQRYPLGTLYSTGYGLTRKIYRYVKI